MGCNLVRGEELKENELIFLRSEDHLAFQYHEAQDLDLIFRKYSFSGLINDKQWELIISTLGLGIGRYIHSDAVRDFYEEFKTSEGYLLPYFLILAVYLSQGGLDIKASILFDAFDPKATKIMTRKTSENMIDGIIFVLIDKMYLLCQKIYPNNESLEVLYEKLMERKDKFKEKFMKMLVSDKNYITKDQFLDAFTDSYAKKLLNSGYLRRAVLADKSKKLSKGQNVVEVERHGGVEETSARDFADFDHNIPLSSEDED
ncbi:hypothetical protein SteCoe_11700 [Stentor coeruleus]|uniref:Uncharacterized protein n=1 Tax=Stentor coeruleus TaxID=5963 RepID=A0A1R2CCI6_9CILI|nr:hypothetical protein SteCoe_11700 [Stentor coeruleus]